MKTSTTSRKLMFVIMIMLFAFQATAQVNYKIHSLFMYKFTQYIEWPSTSGDFVIGVVGSSPIIAELEAIAATKRR